MDKKARGEAKREEQKNYQLIKQGKLKPVGSQKGYMNLKPLTEIDPEKAREIRRKGYEAQQKVLTEKKTAKESLEKLLSIVAKESAKGKIDEDILRKALAVNPNLTLYDVINLKMIESARNGNVKAYVAVRDSVGDKPHDKMDVTAQSLTDDDRALLESVRARIDENTIDVE